MDRLAHIGLLLATFFVAGYAVAAGVVVGKVVKVVDGDTIHVLDPSTKLFKVRLGAIDAPERGQPYFDKSRDHLAEIVAGKNVSVMWHKTDRYKRLVGTVVFQTKDVGLIQVEDGFAWHFKRFAHEQSEVEREAYEAAEERAKARRRNIWQGVGQSAPWEERARKERQTRTEIVK